MLNIQGADGEILEEVRGYYRIYSSKRILILLNLSEQMQVIRLPVSKLKRYEKDMLGQGVKVDEENGTLSIPPLGYYWFFV